MTKNNVKNYFVMSVLILSASDMMQNNAFAAPTLGTTTISWSWMEQQQPILVIQS
ncbi:hypothetical protein [Candidatus Nitrosotenuis sp. DW1]|uniref:hypothetical protein n=1 Tax=Candidatus Nitrosotenuis sp. DW1 TaxID=2259672 RepID=UPI0015C9228F|nr:hypothetical protein [Candidatus Nitrosotenuis sp. DW1]